MTGNSYGSLVPDGAEGEVLGQLASGGDLDPERHLVPL
jgi:hypothetical protein